MKYQIVKHNKTGARTIAMLDTLQAARERVVQMGLYFDGLSYVGGFPTFRTGDGRKLYSIQGSVEVVAGQSVVCSLPQKEAESFT